MTIQMSKSMHKRVTAQIGFEPRQMTSAEFHNEASEVRQMAKAGCTVTAACRLAELLANAKDIEEVAVLQLVAMHIVTIDKALHDDE